MANILPYITFESCVNVDQALANSRLNYGSALLYDISLTILSRLHRIQKQRAHNNYFAAVTLVSREVQTLVNETAPNIHYNEWTHHGVAE